ncbi:Sperm flagellar protein 2, partial [Rhizophlyctis rosea]
ASTYPLVSTVKSKIPQHKPERRRLRRPRITARAAEEPSSSSSPERKTRDLPLSSDDEDREETLFEHVQKHAGRSGIPLPATQYEAQLREREKEKREKLRKKQEQKRLHTISFVRTELSDFEHRLETNQPLLLSSSAPSSKSKSDSSILEPRDSALQESTPSSLDPKEIKRFLSLKAPMDTVNHVKMLSSFLPGVEVQQKQGREYLEKIRLRKLEEEASRKEREQRRRKILLGQQHAQEELEKAHLEESMIAKLMRQSKQERRIAEQLMQVRHEKQTLLQNRQFREHQYALRRQKDYADSLTHEHLLASHALQTYFHKVHLQLLQHREILAEKAAKKHQKIYKHCEEVVRSLVELGLRVAEYRGLNGGKDVPGRMLREWKVLFLGGKDVGRGYDVEMEKDRVETVMVGKERREGEAGLEGVDEEVLKGIVLLDEKEFEEYLGGTGFWSYPGDSNQPIKNEPLGQLIDTILSMTAPPEPVRELPKLPNVPLRLALIGKKFAGKMTLAKKLNEQYGLHLIVVEELVAEAIKLADPSHHHPETTSSKHHKKHLTKPQIGARIQAAMLAGSPPEDHHLIALVVDAIHQVPETQAHGGWVLVDFPRNRNQAVVLEKELSGYEDPKPIKLGNLKRSTPKDSRETSKDRTASKQPTTQKPVSATSADASDPRRRSLIAPTDMKSDTPSTPPQSGIDAVILLDIDNEVAIKRAQGRRVDTVTGK